MMMMILKITMFNDDAGKESTDDDHGKERVYCRSLVPII